MNVRFESTSRLFLPNLPQRIRVNANYMACFGKRAGRDVCDIFPVRRDTFKLELFTFRNLSYHQFYDSLLLRWADMSLPEVAPE